MRRFLLVMALLVPAVSATGCGSKSPADFKPAGVVENPNRPNPEAIKMRKPMLVDPRKGGVPLNSRGKH